MKLHSIVENVESVLDQKFVFITTLWIDTEIPREEAINELSSFFTEPPPGITPVEGKIMSIGEPDDEDLVKVKFSMSLEDFIRNSLEYDQDPYYILSQVKNAAGPKVAKVAHDFMKDPTSSFKRAHLMSSYGGEVDGESWPYNPEL